jgi:hypothetical protein
MSSLVYPVAGGMEDWAYGAGWANQQPPCKNPDYDPERTVYSANDPSFRTAIYLVESSNQKGPPAHVRASRANRPFRDSLLLIVNLMLCTHRNMGTSESCSTQRWEAVT